MSQAQQVAETAVLAVSVGHCSIEGRKRENQDFVGAVVPEDSAMTLKGVVAAVADGISSSRISREASETAIGSLLSDYYCTSDAWSVETAAKRVISASNAWLHTSNRNDHLEDIDHGRVCTLSALILKGREAHILHVGDSRIYRLSGSSLEPLTTDHRTQLPEGKSHLNRALGIAAEVDIDYTRVALSKGAVFLLTTDGVHDFIDGALVAKALADADTLDDAATAIVEAAYERGSDDNLTAQIVRVDNLPPNDERAFDSEASALPLPPIPKAGDVIDGFTILRNIHATARSHVFLAKAPDGSQVALKIPAREMAENPSYLRRFVLEEWIARRLTSPHVLSTAPSPEKRTALYSITPFIEGVTLRQWMTDHPAPSLDEVRGIIDQIAMGLRAFHRKEMLHQDVRPENILIDSEGTVVIIDFGSTSVAGLEEAAPGLAGTMPGTFQYTAPEYLSGEPISRQSDIFALGAITYEMLTGALPYGTQVAKIRSRRDQSRLVYRSAATQDNAIPEWIDETLRKALHPDPLKRHAVFTEFLAGMRAPPADWARRQSKPLIERNPVRFWQVVSLLLGLGLIASLVTR